MWRLWQQRRGGHAAATGQLLLRSVTGVLRNACRVNAHGQPEKQPRTPATPTATVNVWRQQVLHASFTAVVPGLRRQYTTNRDTATAAPPATPPFSSEKAFHAAFYGCPIAARAAALTVAKHQLQFSSVGKSGESTKAAPDEETRPTATRTEKSSYMPLFDFVRRIPSMVRDKMLRDQLDALQWIQESTLLELVGSDGKPVPHTALRPSFVASTGGEQNTVHNDSKKSSTANATPSTPPSYSPLLHVRVVVPPQWVLNASQELAELTDPTEHSTANPDTADDASTTDAAAEDPAFAKSKDAQIILEEVVGILHHLETLAKQRSEDGVEDSAIPVDDDKSKSTVPAAMTSRYVALSELFLQLRHHRLEATLATESKKEVLAQNLVQNLSLKSIDSVLAAYGVLVSVGRARRHRGGGGGGSANDSSVSGAASSTSPCPSYSSASPASAAPSPAYLPISEKPLWVVRWGGRQRCAAVYVALRHPDEADAPLFRHVQPRVTTATLANNYGGWGSALSVPTKEDVYEILKYVPVNWANISALSISSEVKKRHIRCASLLQWLRRQPFYFEVRNYARQVEVRRSIVLHPDVHGYTKSEAWEVLELQLATGEANSLAYVDANGTALLDSTSLQERALLKFLSRVVPTYFTTMAHVMDRFTKKNVSEAEMLAVLRKRPQEFEELRTRFSDVSLVRRRGGADSARWRAAFTADLEKHPEDVRGIMMLCRRMSTAWDRPEYVYVRLTEVEQQLIGGYAGMMHVLRRHPAIFRVGAHYVCRADPSDPLAHQEAEPAPNDVTSRTLLREENPYHSVSEIAAVFHYVAPDNETCTAAYLADCASPAMRICLPPRIVTVVQQFPKLFACTETSPGVFAIRKLQQRVRKPVPRRLRPSNMDAADVTATCATAVGTVASQESAVDGKGDEAATEGSDTDTIQMLEDELAEEEHMSKEELVAAVRTLIPESGVEARQLLLWASMSVQRSANEYHGGLLKMVEGLPSSFRVVTTEDSKMIYNV